MKFRLYPTPDQEIKLLEHCAHARYVWNLGLEQRNMYRPTWGPTPGLNKQCVQLTEAREHTWLSEGSRWVQQHALRDLDQAFQDWWKNPNHFGRPTWRKQHVHEGFRIANRVQWERLSRKRARVRVPKIGWIDWRWSRHPGEPKSYRIKLDRAGRWWIAFAVIPEPVESPGDGSIVGIDRGVAQSFVMSDGEMVNIPGFTDSEARRQHRLKRKLARQTKGSNRRERTKRQINRIGHRKIDRKKDCIEKLTTRLASEYDLIRIEDLKIGNMTRSAKGTMELPGTDVSAKRGLNRAILDQSWGLFSKRLEDKAPGRVEKVNPAFTSQRCFVCEYTAKENRESQAVFLCGSCGYEDNADINAAKNIAAGYAVKGRGDPLIGVYEASTSIVRSESRDASREDANAPRAVRDSGRSARW